MGLSQTFWNGINSESGYKGEEYASGEDEKGTWVVGEDGMILEKITNGRGCGVCGAKDGGQDNLGCARGCESETRVVLSKGFRTFPSTRAASKVDKFDHVEEALPILWQLSPSESTLNQKQRKLRSRARRRDS